VQETPTAYEAFARILAVDDAIDAGEVGRPVALAGAGRGELARTCLRNFDSLGRSRMRGEEIGRARIDRPRPGLDLSSALRPMEVRKRAAP
jgi:hypothetical protein